MSAFKTYPPQYMAHYDYRDQTDADAEVESFRFVASVKTLEIFENIYGEDLFSAHEKLQKTLSAVATPENIKIIDELSRVKTNPHEFQKLCEKYGAERLNALHDAVTGGDFEQTHTRFRAAVLVAMYAAANPDIRGDILAHADVCLPSEVFDNVVFFQELMGMLSRLYPSVKKKR